MDQEKIRTWSKVGETEVPPEKRPFIEEVVAGMEWREVPCELGFMAGYAIKTCIQKFRLPGVTHVTESNRLAPYGFYGIRSHYKNGRVELYLIDTGVDCVPVMHDFYPISEEQSSPEAQKGV